MIEFHLLVLLRDHGLNVHLVAVRQLTVATAHPLFHFDGRCQQSWHTCVESMLLLRFTARQDGSGTELW